MNAKSQIKVKSKYTKAMRKNFSKSTLNTSEPFQQQEYTSNEYASLMC